MKNLDKVAEGLEIVKRMKAHTHHEQWDAEHCYIEGYYCGFVGHPRSVVLDAERHKHKEEWQLGYEDGKRDSEYRDGKEDSN